MDSETNKIKQMQAGSSAGEELLWEAPKVAVLSSDKTLSGTTFVGSENIYSSI